MTLHRLFPALLLAFATGLPQAGLAEVTSETKTNGKSEVTLWLQPFLSAEELAMLRLVQENDQALAIFVPGKQGFAAMAVSPEDGFLKDGQPVASAVALADLPDAATAAKEALAACDAARKGKTPCALVLEVAPK